MVKALMNVTLNPKFGKNVYCNIPKFYDSLNFAVNVPKIEPKVFIE